MTEQKVYDPYASADEAKELPKHYFGQVTLDLWACALEKGVGKVPFDPARHAGQPRTAIDISITPLPSSPVDFVTERRVIAESHDWAGVMLPSLKALNISTRALNGKWVKYELVSTGRTYEAKDADKHPTGEIKTATMPRFLAVYNTEAEAETAAAALYGRTGEPISAPAPASTPTPGNGNAERLVAEKFLPALAAQAGGDPAKLAQILAANPLVSKHFDLNSPEVIALLTKQAEKIPF